MFTQQVQSLVQRQGIGQSAEPEPEAIEPVPLEQFDWTGSTQQELRQYLASLPDKWSLSLPEIEGRLRAFRAGYEAIREAAYAPRVSDDLEGASRAQHAALKCHDLEREITALTRLRDRRWREKKPKPEPESEPELTLEGLAARLDRIEGELKRRGILA